MKIIPITSDSNIKAFNKIAPHPLQSWEWGEARVKMGIDVLRLGQYENDELVNSFQITFHKIPHTPFTVGYLPRSVMPSKEVLEVIRDESIKKNSIFIKIEPYERVSSSKYQELSMLKVSTHALFPNWTQVIDLTKSEAELLENMHSKTRYNIGLAQKKGVVIKEVTTVDGFKVFSRLYFDTCKRQKYRGHTENYHKIIFDSLKKNIAHILIAYYKGNPLAAYELFIFNDVLYYPYGGSLTEHKNVMAPNLLMWEAIRFGKKLGAKKFDMWGSLPPDYDRKSPWAGFTRFKAGYGGEFVEFIGSYDLVINPVLYRLYNIAHSARRKILGMK